MKTKTFSILTIAFFSMLSLDPILGASNELVAITAGEYSKFLNAVEADDPYHFYNEESRVDSTASYIQRSGAPGHYSYVVAQEEAGKSTLCIDPLSAMRYCN